MIDLNRPEAATTAGGELAAQATALVARLAGPPAIASEGELAAAVLERKEIGAQVATVEAFFAPLKSLAHQLHKALCDRESAILGPLKALDHEKRAAMSAYALELDRQRRARERALEDEQRQAREAQAIKEAAQLERAGDHAMAAAVVAEAIAAPPAVVVLPDRRKAIAGLKMRRSWHWRYAGDDKAKALQVIPREYLTADEQKIGAHAASMKESAAIAGIEFYFEDLPVR
jgi:hypothetical protein